MKFAVCLLLASGGAWAEDPLLIEEIVAKVNGDIVTRGDLEKTRQEMLIEMQKQGLSGPTLQQEFGNRSKDILRDRIDQLLLVQKGKDLNINVDSEVSRNIADIQKQSQIADPDKFQEYVRQQTGMPFEDWKGEMKNSMLQQRVVRQEIGSKMNVKHEEIEKYYNEHKTDFQRDERVYLREILVSTENKDAAGVAAAEKKAKDLVARARKGERFPELARDNSDAITARNLGELGNFKKGELNEIIEKAVWTQPNGYITDPIQFPNGFEIFKVDMHRKEGVADLSEVEGEIGEKLYAPRMGPAVRDFLTQLRTSAFLEIKPGYIDSGAAPGKDTSWIDPGTLKPETVSKAEAIAKKRHKRLLWTVPVPGTERPESGVSSSTKS